MVILYGKSTILMRFGEYGKVQIMPLNFGQYRCRWGKFRATDLHVKASFIIRSCNIGLLAKFEWHYLDIYHTHQISPIWSIYHKLSPYYGKPPILIFFWIFWVGTPRPAIVDIENMLTSYNRRRIGKVMAPDAKGKLLAGPAL